jgi:hypothetical protein
MQSLHGLQLLEQLSASVVQLRGTLLKILNFGIKLIVLLQFFLEKFI